MKKSILILASIFAVIFLSSFVMALTEFPAPQFSLAATPFDFLEELLKGIFKAIVESANYILGGADIEAVAFSKLLFGILLFAVIFGVTGKIKALSNKATRMVVSIIVPILGMQALPNETVLAILLPYNTLAIAIVSFIPLIIYAYFLEGINFSWMRKIGWVLAIVAFIGIWSTRPEAVRSEAGWIYGVTALIAVLLLVFDGTIHYWILRSRLKRGEELAINDQVAFAFSEYEAAAEAYRRTPTTTTEKLLDRKKIALDKIAKKAK